MSTARGRIRHQALLSTEKFLFLLVRWPFVRRDRLRLLPPPPSCAANADVSNAKPSCDLGLRHLPLCVELRRLCSSQHQYPANRLKLLRPRGRTPSFRVPASGDAAPRRALGAPRAPQRGRRARRGSAAAGRRCRPPGAHSGRPALRGALANLRHVHRELRARVNQLGLGVLLASALERLLARGLDLVARERFPAAARPWPVPTRWRRRGRRASRAARGPWLRSAVRLTQDLGSH